MSTAAAASHYGVDVFSPRPGADGALALLSIADRDKPLLGRLAAGLARAGYRFAATAGTAAALAALGHDSRPVLKYLAGGGAVDAPGAEGTPILELIESGELRLVVNTPTPQSGAVRDAAEIRLAATAEGILCLTAIETAVAAAEALDPVLIDRLAEVTSLTEWVPTSPGATVAHAAPVGVSG